MALSCSKALSWVRARMSISAQLRTGHARLNGDLHQIGKTESDLCECGVKRERVPHFLLLCPRWNMQLLVLVEAAGLSLSQMLGGEPEIVGLASERTGRV